MFDTKLKKAFAAACVVIAGLVVVIVIGLRDRNQSSGAETFQTRIPPVEFLYLDGARILDFLAELEGGRVGAVHRISKEIASLSAGGSSHGFTVGASSQHESSAESTITRTEASELGVFLDDLARNESRGVSFHPIDLDQPRSRTRLREGMVVRFVTHDLLSPGYIRPYVVVRQSATLAALFPQVSGDAASAERAAEQRQKAESFAHQIGPDPRITFVVSPRDKDAGIKTVLMPMRYRDLTQERSLMEKGRDQYTGGRLVVFGKVIRVFRNRTRSPGCRGKSQQCPESDRPEYIDFATREIWRNPLEQASNFLIETVSHSCRTPRYPNPEEHSPNAKPIVGRKCFLAKLRRQTELYAPGAVIVPIAIFK